MARVKHPLHSGDAWKDIGKMMTFKRGGIVTSYFRPRDPKSIKQREQRDLFALLYRFLKKGANMQTLKALFVGQDDEPLAYKSKITRARAVFDLEWSAGVNAGTQIVGLLNDGGANAAYVRRVWFQLAFTGTAAATMQRYSLGMVSGVQTLAQGFYLEPATKRAGLGFDHMSGMYFNQGIVYGSGGAVGTLDLVTWRRDGSTSPRIEIDFGDQPLELRDGDMLGVWLDAAAVNGDKLIGGIDWSA